MNWQLARSAINWLLILAGGPWAVTEYTRLATPDTTAGPWDYVLYVGGPALLSGAAWLWRFFWAALETNPLGESQAAKQQSINRAVAKLGDEAGRLAAAGDCLGASAVLTAIDQIQRPQRPDKKPPSMPLAPSQ